MEALDKVRPVKTKLYRLGWIAALLVLLGGSLLQALGGSSGITTTSVQSWGNDDAYISYRYARNLVEGKGLVFNPDERVEAYSNFLYVLMVAPGFWVTDNDGIYFFSLLLNLVLAGIAFGLFAGFLRHQLSPGKALIGVWLFALCLPLWVAVASGLETVLVLLISVAIWITAERVAAEPSRNAVLWLSTLLILSLLARADGFIAAGVAMLYLLLKRRFPDAALCAVSVLAAGGVYELWRYHYYGYLLPNSYYVKVAGSPPARIAHAFLLLKNAAIFEGLLGLLLAWLFALTEAVRRSAGNLRQLAAALRFELVFPIFWLAYWFYIGGDHFWDRFLIIFYPLGIFALLKYLLEGANAKVLAFLAVTLVTLEVLPPLNMDPRFDFDFHKYDAWLMTGKFLKQNYPGKTLATSALGKIAFFSELYTEDILGLADPVIAHRPAAGIGFEPGHMKFDPDYTLARRPDLIVEWINPNGDLRFDLTRAKYQAAGYHVEYLINTGRAVPVEPLVKAQGLDEHAIQEWVYQGYNFAVLARQ